MFETVQWKNNKVVLLDQTRLPQEKIYREYEEPGQVVQAIKDMTVRGAPAIGVTAAFGLALSAHKLQNESLEKARIDFDTWTQRFAKTRPTAVNLFWAIKRMKKCSLKAVPDTETWAKQLLEKAREIHKEDVESCKRIGAYGAKLLQNPSRILTHCNAGALATAGWGTALGIIRSAVEEGKKISVWVDETRPFLQGSRLTAWELAQEEIPATLITDNMAGYLMSKSEVDAVIVGADRIASNGDVANKIGTYSLAVLAHENDVPFYVAAPVSTIDFECACGNDIPIEERSPKEVLKFGGTLVAPEKMRARHPAFDLTPAKYVRAIITEFGVLRSPYSDSIAKIKKEAGFFR